MVEGNSTVDTFKYLLLGKSDYVNIIIAEVVKKKLEKEGHTVEISLYPNVDGENLLETIEKVQKYLTTSYKFMLLADLSKESLVEANKTKKCNVNFNLLEDLSL